VGAGRGGPAAPLRRPVPLPVQTPLPPAPALFSQATGVRSGDLIYVLGGAGGRLVPDPRPASPAAGGARHPPASAVPRAVLDAAASAPPTPAAVALAAAAAALRELGCVDDADASTSPPPSSPSLVLTYAGARIRLTAYTLGPRTAVVAAGAPAAVRAPCAFQAALAVPADLDPTAAGTTPRLSRAGWLALADGVALPAASAAARAAGADPPPCLASLPHHVLLTHILNRVSGRDLAAVACSSRPLWGAVESADALWAARLSAEHGAAVSTRGTHADPRAAFAAAERARAATRALLRRGSSLGFAPQPWAAAPPGRYARAGGDYDRLPAGGMSWGGGGSFGGGGRHGARGGLPLRGGRWQPPPP